MRLILVAGLSLVLSAASVRAEEVPVAALPQQEPPLWQWNQPRPYEVAVLVFADALIWVDVYQTRRNAFKSYPFRRVEQNGWLGPTPSPGKVFWVGGVVSTLVTTAVWYALPSGWRILVPGGVIGGEGYAVVSNAMNH